MWLLDRKTAFDLRQCRKPSPSTWAEHRGRPRSGLPDGSVGADVCTNPTPWPAWAAAPRARPEVLADRATSTFTQKARHGTNGAATWAAAAWKHSLARACPALAGACARLTEAAGRVEPGDVCRPGRAPVSQDPPRLFLTIRSHPSSPSSDEDILHQMKPARRRAGQEHFRGRAGRESRGWSAHNLTVVLLR